MSEPTEVVDQMCFGLRLIQRGAVRILQARWLPITVNLDGSLTPSDVPSEWEDVDLDVEVDES